jgi:hypothetical protein
LRRDQSSKNGDRFLTAAFLRQRQAEAILSVRGSGIKTDGRLEVRDRPIQIAECLERDAQPQLRNRQRWIQPDCGAQLVNGWLEAPEAL